MTAPDHRPYLLATDLRTAEDAAWWLRIDRTERLKAYRQDGGRGVFPCDADLLYARLDRERRQACRRGARRTFADAAELMRGYALEQKCGVVRDTGIEYAIGHYLTRALAFRAAARQP